MIVYSRQSKYGKIEVFSEGLTYILIDGKKLNCAFYEDERAIAYANNDRLICKCKSSS
jgi:hypothetical protein